MDTVLLVVLTLASTWPFDVLEDGHRAEWRGVHPFHERSSHVASSSEGDDDDAKMAVHPGRFVLMFQRPRKVVV